ncbi:MAG: flavin reductase family protein [Polaromonas sp.]|nr:flavin reductase family protein [Polaromonas sp.]
MHSRHCAAGLTHAVGSQSSRTVDKFAQYGLNARSGPVPGMPLPEGGCAAWLEYRLIRETHIEDAYDTCFSEVVAAAADERVFQQGHWRFRNDNLDLQTSHHVGGASFVKPGGMFMPQSALISQLHDASAAMTMVN